MIGKPDPHGVTNKEGSSTFVLPASALFVILQREVSVTWRVKRVRKKKVGSHWLLLTLNHVLKWELCLLQKDRDFSDEM